ncbi:galactose-binding domain-containing protein [Actinacidiphila guanduensis]|uniref:Glycosyl hydrolases family 2, TIM barrel domain n=1 Tax=Actinacidiphila guanduensis TaxID=310781 RepID=A0A1H0HSC3_9ACTN|nr:discoidin domain-containing protein [Actinacidiphila guanduensis]SDO21970.1 Glycosyl hydrolases family 2, TIM barrel domain [Actinacidiphila guanduensis]
MRASPSPTHPLRTLLLALLAAGLALYALAVPAPQAHAADALLSQGRPATSSSTEGDGYAAANAVDGNTATRWASSWSDPQWLQVDLGASATLDKVVLAWENYATAYQIQVSDDASHWTSVYSTTTGSGGTQTLAVSGSGRYVRMYGTMRQNGYGYSLWEFQVYGTAGGSGGTTGGGTGGGGTPPPGDWTTLWSDGFDGSAGSPPAPADWTIDTGTAYPGGAAQWGTGEVETATNSPANVSLDGSGHLDLTALKSGGSWTSGRVETKRSDFAAPAGGRLQISAVLKQPDPAKALGYWPSFRAMGAGYRGNPSAWPAVGESDIMEDVNGRGQLSATLHCGTAPGGNCAEYDGLTSGLASCTGCQSGYHTYSEVIDRTTSDEQIRFYLDGHQIWQVNESQVGTATWQAAFDHGVYVDFSLRIGGSYPNAVCGCTSPADDTSSGGVLSIDSVTVSQTTGSAPPPLTDPPVPSGGSSVHVTGSQGNWQLTVDGKPWQVKGMTWGPATSTADAHMRDLKAMGVNTLRTWGTDATSKPLLDSAAAYGLKVINGFWLNQGADYVNDTAYKNDTLNAIKQWVTAYKDNPGVLMWDVGNEVILTTQDHFSGDQVEQERIAYAKYVEQVVQAIHAIDPNHPVTSTDAWTGAWPYYKQYTPDLDLYAVNSYGAVCSVKQDWVNGGYTKPYIVTESGEAGEWEVPNDANGVPTEPTDTQKRDGYLSAWNCVSGHTGVALGATLFNYGQENDFGGVWFNVLPEGWKRLSYYAVAKDYGGSPQADTPPVIGSMTLSNTSTVPAGGQFTVTAPATDPDGDFVRYQLMYSSKYVDGGTGLHQVAFTQTGDGAFTVTAPATLGVWKVYVYAYDGHGNVGIETRSFRVVAPTVGGPDLAQGRPTTASTYQATGDGAPFPAGNATDGKWDTRWASEWSDPQWLQVDLGQVTAIRHVQLGWEAAYGKAYQVQVSTDGSSWTTVYATSSGAGGVETLDVSGSGRYVRVNMTQRGTAYGYSLYEFGVYG